MFGGYMMLTHIQMDHWRYIWYGTKKSCTICYNNCDLFPRGVTCCWWHRVCGSWCNLPVQDHHWSVYGLADHPSSLWRSTEGGWSNLGVRLNGRESRGYHGGDLRGCVRTDSSLMAMETLEGGWLWIRVRWGCKGDTMRRCEGRFSRTTWHRRALPVALVTIAAAASARRWGTPGSNANLTLWSLGDAAVNLN